MPARDHFAAKMTAEIDRRCWRQLLETLGFDQLLDRQAREEFYSSLTGEPPAFTSENCAATFGHIWENRRDIYLRGIANSFSALDRRFRSHDGFKIGSRLIIERALNDSRSYWTDYNRRDTLRDVESVFRELDGQGHCPETKSIDHLVTAHTHSPTPHHIQRHSFPLLIFRHRNLHLWFEGKELLGEGNKLVA